MIEVIFVIVILGILAAIAIPKFAATRTDAQLAKGRSDVSTIRSAILTERQSRLVTGDHSWISELSDNATTLFKGKDDHILLMYGIKSGTTSGHWRTTDSGEPYVHYKFKIGATDCAFSYDSSDGSFTLDDDQDSICNNLVE